MKKVLLLIVVAIMSTTLMSAQGKGKTQGVGPTITVPVYFQSSNPATVTIIDDETGTSYSVNSAGGSVQYLTIPKKTTYTIWMTTSNSSEVEENYWLMINGSSDWVGITLQPGESRSAGAVGISLDRDSSLTFTDVRPSY